MKFLFFSLLLPLLSAAQTIHVEDGRIRYQAHVVTEGLAAADINARLPKAMSIAAKESQTGMEVVSLENGVQAKGSMRLNTPFNYKRTVHFTLLLAAADGGYDYSVDSVSVTDQRRGGSTKTRDSKELLEGMDESGKTAIETEKLLNEIDMRLQKFLRLLENNVRSKMH